MAGICKGLQRSLKADQHQSCNSESALPSKRLASLSVLLYRDVDHSLIPHILSRIWVHALTCLTGSLLLQVDTYELAKENRCLQRFWRLRQLAVEMETERACVAQHCPPLKGSPVLLFVRTFPSNSWRRLLKSKSL